MFDKIYTEVTLEKVEGFIMASYVMVTPNPEDDANEFMDAWAKKSGLLDFGKETARIGWDFPCLSQEQIQLGMRGYVAAYIVPEGFEADFSEVELEEQEAAQYAVLSIENPFEDPFDRIPGAYQTIIKHMHENGLKENTNDTVLSCFEYIFEEDGVTYMNVYIQAEKQI